MNRKNLIQPIDFYFLRHGETDWNLEHRGMGQKDIPLNAKGIGQAHRASDILASEKIATICYSPLMRAKVTAKIIGSKIKCPMVEVPALIECCRGENEGKKKDGWVENWIAGENIAGAESYQQFLERALNGINQSLQQKVPVLIVAHGGVFWAIQHFAKIGQRFDLQNATPVYLRAPRNQVETNAVVGSLHELLGNFYFRANGLWSASRKHIPQSLIKIDPVLHKALVSAFDEAFKGKIETVILLADQITNPFGGFLFDGYRREAPKDWKLPIS